LAHCHPLFFAPPRRLTSRIPAAKAMSVADNFLQKQQKQRERDSRKAAAASPWAEDKSGHGKLPGLTAWRGPSDPLNQQARFCCRFAVHAPMSH